MVHNDMMIVQNELTSCVNVKVVPLVRTVMVPFPKLAKLTTRVNVIVSYGMYVTSPW